MFNGESFTDSSVSQYSSIFLFCLTYHSFFVCTPEAPGDLSLLSPISTVSSTIPSPVNLSWSVPVPLGFDCQLPYTPVYHVSLSQSNPPEFFTATSNTFLEVKNIPQGIWYWAVSASNSYFATAETDVWTFEVRAVLLFLVQSEGLCTFLAFSCRVDLSPKWLLHS